MLIRPAGNRDFAAIYALFAEENRFHAELLPDVLQVVEPIITREWLQNVLEDANEALFVAEVGEQVAGVTLLRHMTMPDDDIFKPRQYVYIEEITVAAAFRARGIGRALMVQAEAWAHERNVNQVELHVWKANTSAITFYETLGYTVTQYRMQRDSRGDL